MEYLKRYSEYANFSHLLLLVFLIDDYLRDKTRKSSNTAIFFSIANFATDVRATSKKTPLSRKIIMIIISFLDIFEAI
jgi:hypothetical protein